MGLGNNDGEPGALISGRFTVCQERPMTTDTSPSLSVPFLTLAQSIRRQFEDCPSLQDVAANVLRHSLGERYRWLTIDLQQPVVMEPVYSFDGKTTILQGHNALTLVDALIERCASGCFVDFGQGQFLSRSAQEGIQLKLNIENSDLEQVINERGATLIERYQEALVDYWMQVGDDGKVRYLWLAQALKNQLVATLISAQLTNEQMDMIVDVTTRTVRPQVGNVRAYIVDRWGESGAVNLEMLRGLVLVKQGADKDSVLLFTLAHGVQAFDSLDALGFWLVGLLTEIQPTHYMQWRLYEPAGDIFQSLSLTYLAKQLSDIQALLPQVREFGNQQRLLERALGVVASDFDSAPTDIEPLTRLRSALPGWLSQAAPALQRVMSHYAIELAGTLKQPGWKPFDEGIAPPFEFACKALSEQLLKEHPEKLPLDPDQIIVTMAVDDAAQGDRKARFWSLPAGYTHSTWSLSRFAWLGANGIDPAQLTLTPTAWLTAEQALTLVKRANVRAAYSRLITEKLRDDQSEVTWRKARFIEQLRLQLPMQALEYHLKFSQAFSRQAYDNVIAILQPARKGQVRGVVLRPLALKTTVQSTPDRVLNMFVIGPQVLTSGPYVLYRPMSKVKLIEFSSWERLRASITQPGPLQYQVLAWMPEAARSRYLKPDLAMPGVEVLPVLDFNESVLAIHSAQLGEDEVEGDYLEQLFLAAVEAMCGEPAAPEPSRLEVFWNWVKDHFGLGLTLVLPFLPGRYIKVAGWLLAAWSAWQASEAIIENKPDIALLHTADFFLSLGLVLLSRGRVTTTLGRAATADTLLDMARGLDLEESITLSWEEAPEHLLEGAATSRSATPQVRAPTLQGSSSFVRSDPRLEQSWSGLYSRLSVIRRAELALYRVRAVPYARRIDAGSLRGLFSAGNSVYANVGGDWFKVEKYDGKVYAINDDIAHRRGPQLQSRNAGVWAFAVEPVQSDDFLDALAQEQQRLAQLTSDQDRRVALNAEYDRVSAEFDSLIFTDDATLQSINGRLAEPETAGLIEEELVKAQASHWCAVTLLDALKRRRQLMLVKNYSALYNRFSAGAVKARRAQLALYESRRRLFLRTDQLNFSAFDAQNLELTVLDRLTWPQTRSRLADYSVLYTQAIEASRDAEQRFQLMRQQGRVADVSVASLEASAWNGRRTSLKWQELQLRSLALQCFNANPPPFKDDAFDLIQDITLLCSVKLMSRRELFSTGRFNLDQQLRVLNDTLDSLVLADCRLSYELSRFPAYINSAALDNYRCFIRSVFRELQDDLVYTYERYEQAPLAAISAKLDSGAKRLIEEPILGRAIGNYRQALEDAEQQRYVEVLEPFDHRRVWAFRASGAGQDTVWRTLEEPQPLVRDVAAERLADIGYEANRLVQQALNKFRSITRLETISRIPPQGLRRECLNYANRLIVQRDLLNDVIRATESAGRQADLVAFFKPVPAAMYDQVNRFQWLATTVRDRMAMREAPTSDSLLLLYKAWKIEIIELPVVEALVREFDIRERSTGRPKWYARFHYDSAANRDVGFHYTRGTLKRYEERNFSYANLKRRASNVELRINVLRSNIDHEVAEQVFFTEEVDPSA